MTTQQRILITIGGCLLVAMMVLGAFSLGVYVGSGRDTSPRLGPGPGPAPGALQGQPPGPDMPRLPDIVGRIENASGDTLTIATAQGFRTVQTDQDTRIVRQDGSDDSRDDLRPGRSVAVIGAPSADGRSFLAEIIALVEPPGIR